MNDVEDLQTYYVLVTSANTNVYVVWAKDKDDAKRLFTLGEGDYHDTIGNDAQDDSEIIEDVLTEDEYYSE